MHVDTSIYLLLFLRVRTFVYMGQKVSRQDSGLRRAVRENDTEYIRQVCVWWPCELRLGLGFLSNSLSHCFHFIYNKPMNVVGGGGSWTFVEKVTF